MSVLDSLAALVLAALALYGLGLPVAWLLPAPAESPWVHRISIAPLYAIVLTGSCAWVLRELSIPLHPLQLVAFLVVAWTLAWSRTRQHWLLRESIRAAVVPATMVATAGVVWFFSLVGYGLYLPNRDFKNHAYFVAQVASSRSSDPRLVFREFPFGAPTELESGYPLGLHIPLGWALPAPDWNSVGVTAAAACLATSITLPLAMVTLARLWVPAVPSIAWVAGMGAIVLPGITGPFAIGAVPLLVGTGCYAACLAVMWLWFRDITLGTTLALAASGLGLVLLHISEAIALGCVFLVAFPAWLWRTRPALNRLMWISLGSAAIVTAAAAFLVVRPNLPLLNNAEAWDVEPNTFGLVDAILVGFLKAVSDRDLSGVIWIPLVLAGVWIAVRRGLSLFPVVWLVVALALCAVAGVGFMPSWVRLLALPWYGAIGRVALLGVPAVLLIGSLALGATLAGSDLRPRRWQFAVAVCLIVASLAIPGRETVPGRRASLSATLAGAGDTPRVAAELAQLLRPGESVLNFEGDGGAQLFAIRRLPIVSALADPDAPRHGEHPYWVAIRGLADVSQPEVATSLRALHVAYVAVGTTSVYWNEMTGYGLHQFLRQPEFKVVLNGTDMVVLRYEPGAS